MKICLTGVYDRSWIAGFYYVVNLVRALRRLPVNEQPSLFLMVSKESASLCDEEGISGQAEILLSCGPSQDRGKQSSVAGIGRRSVLRILEILSPGGNLKASIQRVMDRPLEKTLHERGISMIFPCLRSLGAGFSIPWLPWIPDLQHKHYPDFFTKDELKGRDDCYARLGRDASLVVFSSQVCLEDFDRFFPGHRPKLRVLHFRTVPNPEWFETNTQEIIAKHRLPDSYLLVPNQFWVHKNHRVVFEAAKILSDRGMRLNLVCTGNTADYRRPEYFGSLLHYLQENGIESQVRIMGFIPRSEQIQIMRRSAAIIQPSLFEGWSTVVEDARCLCKTVFLSDIPVHRQQELPGAVFFDPCSPEQLADAIFEERDALRHPQEGGDEAEALSRQERLVTDYARSFLALAAEMIHPPK